MMHIFLALSQGRQLFFSLGNVMPPNIDELSEDQLFCGFLFFAWTFFIIPALKRMVTPGIDALVAVMVLRLLTRCVWFVMCAEACVPDLARYAACSRTHGDVKTREAQRLLSLLELVIGWVGVLSEPPFLSVPLIFSGESCQGC